jgi:hypothetical protein
MSLKKTQTGEAFKEVLVQTGTEGRLGSNSVLSA